MKRYSGYYVNIFGLLRSTDDALDGIKYEFEKVGDSQVNVLLVSTEEFKL